MIFQSEPGSAQEKPCLVETGRGFSVSYKNRLLYSKYAPEKTIIKLIDDLKILPGTLFIVFSPVLWHGLKNLLEKLPQNCFILAVEADKNLYDFSKKYLDKIILENKKNQEKFCSDINQKVLFLHYENLNFALKIVLNKVKSKFPPVYLFRRAVSIEFSGGASFYKEFYQKISFQIQNAIGSFWKNRLTLTKLGRLYSRNIFKNLAKIPFSTDFSNFKGKIDCPIFIFGAGESAVENLKKISKNQIEKCFILCVDAALPILNAFNITPDAVVAVESQLAIEKAYIGSKNCAFFIFADLTSRPGVLNHTSKDFSFFSSEFTDANFLTNLQKNDFFPETIPPLGSVGLTASCLALLMRKAENVPIFAAGLDFDFSLGKTHAQNAPSHILRLIKSNRFLKIENYDASFKAGAKKIGKIGETDFFTDISLSGYAESFKDSFSSANFFFNCTDFGLNIGIPFVNSEQVDKYLGKTEQNETILQFRNKRSFLLEKDVLSQNQKKNGIKNFLNNEKNALERIKSLLTNGKEKSQTQTDFEDELKNLVSEREYLFLHFPDGYKCGTENLSFLKRIRGEIDFFLKDIKQAESFI